MKMSTKYFFKYIIFAMPYAKTVAMQQLQIPHKNILDQKFALSYLDKFAQRTQLTTKLSALLIDPETLSEKLDQIIIEDMQQLSEQKSTLLSTTENLQQKHRSHRVIDLYPEIYQTQVRNQILKIIFQEDIAALILLNKKRIYFENSSEK